ncbi:MAG: hypothetical protein WAT21_16605 [Saprospiraceae bacterium]
MNLAAFKKLCVKGAKVHCIHAKYGDMGIRTISVVQSNAVAFRTKSGSDSYLYFPKAKDLVYNKDADTWVILSSDKKEPLLYYKFIEQV